MSMLKWETRVLVFQTPTQNSFPELPLGNLIPEEHADDGDQDVVRDRADDDGTQSGADSDPVDGLVGARPRPEASGGVVVTDNDGDVWNEGLFAALGDLPGRELESGSRGALQPEPKIFREAFDVIAAAFLRLLGGGEDGPFVEFDLAVRESFDGRSTHATECSQCQEAAD